MIQLRAYQSDAIDKIREEFRHKRKPLLVSPTGSGKTVLFSWLAARVSEKRKRVYILSHRTELIDQISDCLRSFHVEHSCIAANYIHERQKLVQVCSVFSLARRVSQVPRPDLVIIDEAHHAISGSTWSKILTCWPNAHLLGVTATPQRMGGEGLSDIFDTLVMGPTVAELIRQGYLADYILYAPPGGINTDGVHTRMGEFARDELESRSDQRTITGRAVDHYRKHADGLPAVAFCVSINHAKHVAEQFREAGYRSLHIDGKMDRSIRAGINKDFKAGKIHVLTSCDLISEGYDMPGIYAAILLRPTQSLALYLQQVGRSLRPAPGKKHAVILDHAGNSRHGLPDDDREWSLFGRAHRKSTSDAPSRPVTLCQKCFAAISPTATTCKHCGHTLPGPQGRMIDETDEQLQVVDKSVLSRQKFKENKRATTRDGLVALGIARGYKNAEKWADHVLAGRAAKHEKMRGSR